MYYVNYLETDFHITNCNASFFGASNYVSRLIFLWVGHDVIYFVLIHIPIGHETPVLVHDCWHLHVVFKWTRDVNFNSSEGCHTRRGLHFTVRVCRSGFLRSDYSEYCSFLSELSVSTRDKSIAIETRLTTVFPWHLNIRFPYNCSRNS